MNQKKILVVEDSFEQLKRYKDLITPSFKCSVASTLEEAFVAMDREPIDIVLTDIHLSESMQQNSYEGFEVIKYAKDHHPNVVILAMSADPKIETYRKAYELGAHHWVKKPIIDLDELQIAVDVATRGKFFSGVTRDATTENLPPKLQETCKDGLVLDEKTRKLVKGLAKSRTLPCVVYGETGTGKEEVAKLIHKRRTEVEGHIPFVAVNCANLNIDMAISILFGHKRGSFTGADKTTDGLIGEANGGILFLDEIHRLSEECQAKLLRVLNDGTYERLGDSKTLKSDFQTIAASTKDLDDSVEDGEFLMDLRSRLTGIDIHLKPLRERKEEIDILVPLFYAKEGVEVYSEQISAISERCKEYFWQGNIRQLYNVLRSHHAICTLNEESLSVDSFPEYKTMLAPGHTKKTEGLSKYLVDDYPFKEGVEEFERQIISNAMARHKTKTDVVKALGMSRSSFDAKVSRYGL